MDDLLRATAQAEARHFWFRGFRAFVTPLLHQASAGRSRTGSTRILDCGCGTGANLALLNRFGRAYGFDISPVGVRIARQSGRTLIARASVAAVPFPSASFDIVTSFDVLYSLDDPTERSAIVEMYRLLKPGGAVIVNVAALESLRGDHSVLSHEIRRYSKAGVAEPARSGRLLGSYGITYTNFSLFLPMWISRSIQRRRGLRDEKAAQQEITVPVEPINAVLSALLLAESLWLRVFNAPAGSSLLCLARKP
jgi:SAM-dependent methyltransferase